MARQGDGAGKPSLGETTVDLPTDATIEGVRNLQPDSQPRADLTVDNPLGATLDSEPGRPRSASSRVSINPFPVAQWDRYEFQKLLGQGGMGAVYKARDRRLDRLVALKFIRNDDEQQIHRFMQEARAQSRIDHPGICKVHEVGEVDGKAYIAMQFIDGVSLQQAARGMSLHDKVAVIRDAALALHAAHELQIIHRDIKPANIMIERTASGGYRPVIMDFGLAREAGDGRGLTESGTVMGTPAYMSPEQARGDVRHLDRRSDVYSLGATLYDILAGVPPFEDQTVVNIILKVITDDPTPLRQIVPTVPEALDTIVHKCLNKEPAQRYDSARDLADDLTRFLGNERIVGKRLGLGYRLAYRARRNKPVAALVGALFLTLLGFAGAAVRNRLETLRKEREARAEAELSQKLGRYVKDLEWLVRTAYMLPLHDTTPDKALVRERMAEIDTEIRGYGQAGARLGHYALGRGHLALHEWNQAYEHLKQAESLGYKDLELDYALGRVLGEKFSKAIEDARKSGDKSFFEKRRKELETEYLQPALAYLQRSRKLKTVSTSYLEGLIDYYNRRYDAALINAHFAQKQTPWLYEAIQLEGDVYMARALDQKDHGENEQAALNFQHAISLYENAATIGRSDNRLYEAVAEAWIRQEEIKQKDGQNPIEKMQKSLAAVDRAIEVAPAESNGYTKRAFAYMFLAKYEESRGGDELEPASRKLIAAGKAAVLVHPDDEYAHDAIGIGYILLGQYDNNAGKSYKEDFASAQKSLKTAISINKKFPWAYNDLGISYMLEGSFDSHKNINPETFYNEAIIQFKEAISLDGSYYYPSGNLTFVFYCLASWKLEYGVDPSVAIKNAAAFSEASLKIDKNFIVPIANTGFSYGIGALYDYFSLRKNSQYVEFSLEYFRKFFTITDRIPIIYQEYVFVLYLNAMFVIRQNRDPTEIIATGRQSVKKCHDINNGTFDGCLTGDGLLLTALAEWQQRSGLSPLASLATAMAAAHAVNKSAKTELSVLLAVGQLCQHSATLKTALHQPIREELVDGFAAIDQALVQAPGLPRALAAKGALLLLKGKSLPPGAERSATFSQAQTALAQAIAGNALLKNVYGENLREAEQLGQR